MTEFSIIIPVYNEEKIIRRNLQKLQRYLSGYDCEIIVSNNGSTDKTLEIARNVKDVVTVTTEIKGTGIAFTNGVRIARSSIIILLDIDNTTDLRFIDDSLKLIKKYDIVSGSKIKGSQKRSIIRITLGHAYKILAWLILGIKYTDYASAAKCYRKEKIKKYIERLHNGTTHVTELLYYAAIDRLKVVEIPVYCVDNRKSKFNIILESLRMFVGLIRLKFAKAR